MTGRTLLVPDGAGGLATLAGAGWRAARERLWNAAEAAERRVNSTVAREYELALPAELDAAGREALAVGFAREVVSRFGVRRTWRCTRRAGRATSATTTRTS